MKHKLLAVALLSAFSLASHAASAQDLSYTYVEGGYLNVDRAADGAYLRGSYNFGDSGFYGFGSYARVTTDFGGFAVRPAEAGVGYHGSVSRKVDLIGELAYARVDTDFGDAHGYRGSFGARAAFTPKFEGLAKINYTDGGDFSGETSGTLGAQYKFTQTWGVTGEMEFGQGGARNYLVGVRASF